MTEELDPTPTMFGISRIASENGDGGAGELSRAMLWINQRAKRFAFRGQLIADLIGDPIAAQNRRADFQPLRDFQDDMRNPVFDFDADQFDSSPIGNQGLNP